MAQPAAEPGLSAVVQSIKVSGPTQGPLLLQPPPPPAAASALPALFNWLSLPSPRSVAISTCWPTPSTTSLMGWLWLPASW